MSEISDLLHPKKLYLISYDLIKGKDYKRLIDEIKRKYKPRSKPLESVWIIKSSTSCSEVFDNLSNYVDEDDKLIVLELNNVGNWTETLGLKSREFLEREFTELFDKP